MPKNIIYLPPSTVTVRPSDLLIPREDDNVISPDRLAGKLDKRKRDDNFPTDTSAAPPPPGKRERSMSPGDAPPPTPFPALVTMAMQHAVVDTMRTLGDQLTRLKPHLSDVQRVQLWSLYATSYLRGYVRREPHVVRMLADAMLHGVDKILPQAFVAPYQKALLQVFEAVGGAHGPNVNDIGSYGQRIGEDDAMAFLDLMPLYFLSARAGVVEGLSKILERMEDHPRILVSIRASELRRVLRKCWGLQQAYTKLGGISLTNLEIAAARLFNVHVNGLDEGERIVTLQNNMREVYTALSKLSNNGPLQGTIDDTSGHLYQSFLIASRNDAANLLDLTPTGQRDEAFDLFDEDGNIALKYDVNTMPFHLTLRGDDGAHAVGMRINTEAPEGVTITLFNTGYGTQMYHQNSVMRLKSETSLPVFEGYKKPQTGTNCASKSYRMLEAYAIGPVNYFRLQQARRYMVAMALERKLADNPGGADDFPARELLRLVREKLTKRLLPAKDASVSYVNSQFRVEGIPLTRLKSTVNRLLAIVESSAPTLLKAIVSFYGTLGAQTDVAELAQVGGIQDAEAGMVVNALVSAGYAMELGPASARKLHVTKSFVEAARQDVNAAVKRIDQNLLFGAFPVYDGALEDIVNHLFALAKKQGYLAVAPFPTYRNNAGTPPKTPLPTRASSPTLPADVDNDGGDRRDPMLTDE